MPISLPVTTMTIGGVSYDADDLADAGIDVESWGWSLDDGDLDAEFTEAGPETTSLAAYSIEPGTAIEISVDGTRRFFGETLAVHPAEVNGAWRFGHRCVGPKALLNRYHVTAATGVGRLAYNLDPRATDYVESYAGLSLGDILDDVLTVHASQLAAVGISTDATTDAQLAALTLVPIAPVYLSGPLGQSIDGLLRRWGRHLVFHVNGAGKARFIDATGGTSLTLAEGDDFLEPVRFGVDLRGCATRVQVRGGADIAGYYATILDDTLVPAWSGTQQDDWTIDDFRNPADAYDVGAVTSITGGGTILTLDPDDAAREWGANFWPHREASIIVEKTAGSGLTFTESRPVTACDALTAGGTATVTLAFALDNAGSGAYDRYKLIGTAGDLTGTDASRNDVWRLFDVVTPGGLVEGALVSAFPAGWSFFGYRGDSITNVTHPTAIVIDRLRTFPVPFRILPQTGQIRFVRPIVEPFNSLGALEIGGDAVRAPDDLYALLAYSRGALAATYPPDSGGAVFSGDAFTAFGFEATHFVDVDQWQYKGDLSQFLAYATMLHAALSVPRWSGSARVLGAYAAAFEPCVRLSIDPGDCGASYVTGHEALAAPVRAFRLVYHRDAAGGVLHHSELSIDSHRDPAMGDEHYTHATRIDQLGFKFSFGGGLDLSAAGRSVASALGGQSQFLDAAHGGGADQLAAMGHQANAAIGTMTGQANAAIGTMTGQANAATGGMADQFRSAIDAILKSLGGRP